MRLFTPGPTHLPEEVQRDLGRDMIHHRSPQFQADYEEFVKELKLVFNVIHGDVVIFTSSGTGAMEASVSNLFNAGEKVICLINGYFGQRLADIASSYRLNIIAIERPWGQAILPSEVKAVLDAHPDVKGVLTTYCDTSTGVMTDISSIGKLCRSRDTLLVVDAISGSPYNPLDFEKDDVDFIIAASQKGFSLPPGAAFAIFNDRAWKRIETCTQPRYYFDIRRYMKTQRNNFEVPFSPNIPVFRAGGSAIKTMLTSDIESFRHHAKHLMALVDPMMVKWGFHPVVPVEHRGVGLLVYEMPDRISSSELRLYLMENYDITVESGLGPRRDEIVRIGLMSALTEDDIQDLLKGIHTFMMAKQMIPTVRQEPTPRGNIHA